MWLNQDCKTEPVTAKSQVSDCKVTSLWRQSHKLVTAKSQACGCKVTKRLTPTQQSNSLLKDCSLCWDNKTLLGNLYQEVCRSQSSVWNLIGVVFKACDCMGQTKGIPLWRLIDRLIPPRLLIKHCPNIFPVWKLINPWGFYNHNYTLVIFGRYTGIP
jgi:hypothetical protein